MIRCCEFGAETSQPARVRSGLPRKFLLAAWSSGEAGFEDNSVPECFKAFDQAMGGSNGVGFVEVVRAEFLVRRSSLHHVVTGGKDGTGERDQRPLGTA